MCSVSLEWPPLASLVAKAQEPRGCLKRLSDTVRQVFNIANVTNPEDEGVIDHMVSVTTAMRSPFIAVACHTVSTDSLDPLYSSQHPPATVRIRLLSFQQHLAHLNWEQITTLCRPVFMTRRRQGLFPHLCLKPKYFNPLPKSLNRTADI